MKQETEWIEWFCFFLLIPSYSGGSRGSTRGGRPPLLLDQTKAQRVEKTFLRPPSPLMSQGRDDPFPPRPPYSKVWIRHWVNQANWRVGFFVVILSGLCRLLNRELKQRRRRQKKSIRFRSEERTLHVLSHAFVHFSAETSEYDVKLPNFAFHGGRERNTFLFFF